MRWSDIRPCYPVLWLALLAGLMLSAGCCTGSKAPLFTVAGPGWHVQEGQALWRPRQRYPEIGGDVLLATHEDGRCLIQFSKTPISLMLAQTTGTNWLIQFPPAHMSFGGRRQPPTRFAWLYLHAALAGQPLPKTFRFDREPDGGWRLENTHSGETLRGFLVP
jgi:hypothetical protein